MKRREQLRHFMHARGWSTLDLALRIPCGQRAVQRYLSGERSIGDAIWERIKSLGPEAQPVKRQNTRKGDGSREKAANNRKR